MQRSVKRGPPKHLEKMLFINHKEDLMLDDRLSQLNLRSRQKIMELDLERIKVRNEWRNSRKKNVTLSEAIASGMLPPEQAPAPNLYQGTVEGGIPRTGVRTKGSLAGKRPTASAPPRKKISIAQSPLSRAATFFKEPGSERESVTRSFQTQPSIPEHEEVFNTPTVLVHRRDAIDTVGAYVLDEFEKVSQIVPDILRALAKKKEKYEEEKEQARIAHDLKANVQVDLLDYEPDMNKVRKTVSSVKKLRHRMAISKKLEVNKPKMSFDQMVRDRTENIGEYDEYTDGICVLMKRKLDKKRKVSSVHSDSDLFMRRQSFTVPSTVQIPRRVSSLPELGTRRPSGISPSSLPRRASTLGLGASPKAGSLGADPDTGAAVIDEDELINRQRILRELGKYELLRGKVNRFLLQRRPGSRAVQRALDELASVH